jgi:hypothetical protein
VFGVRSVMPPLKFTVPGWLLRVVVETPETSDESVL